MLQLICQSEKRLARVVIIIIDVQGEQAVFIRHGFSRRRKIGSWCSSGEGCQRGMDMPPAPLPLGNSAYDRLALDQSRASQEEPPLVLREKAFAITAWSPSGGTAPKSLG